MNSGHTDSPPSLEGWDIRQDSDVGWSPGGRQGGTPQHLLASLW